MNDVIAFRRALHSIPEPDRDLPETTAYVRGILGKLSCKIFTPSPGSLCAFFNAGKPDTLAFRADMDALPMEEATGLPYASRHAGCMHACGHDGHTAMLLGLAQAADAAPALPHNLLLLFQCAEETTGGARDLCQSGVLEAHGVTAVFGMHIWPGLELGKVYTRPGPVMAQSAEVYVDIAGKSAHIARAAEGADALYAGAVFLRRAREGAAALLPAEEKRVLGFGLMHSGTALNAISAHTEIKGSLRCFSREMFNGLNAVLREACAAAENETGCACAYALSDGYPPVVNDPALYARLNAYLGADAPALLPSPNITAEDFSFYGQHAPAVFFFLGAGDTPPLHATNFNFDESCLEKGLDFYQKLLYFPG